jgi:hypothetical protein
MESPTSLQLVGRGRPDRMAWPSRRASACCSLFDNTIDHLARENAKKNDEKQFRSRRDVGRPIRKSIGLQFSVTALTMLSGTSDADSARSSRRTSTLASTNPAKGCTISSRTREASRNSSPF